MVCGGLYQHHEGRKEGRHTSESFHTHHIGLERNLGVVVSIGIYGVSGGADVSIYAHTCAKWCGGGLYQHHEGQMEGRNTSESFHR